MVVTILVDILSFIGKTHPLLVHLPIGILLMGILLQWMTVSPKYAAYAIVLRPVFLAGFVSAVLSCISGYTLSGMDDYDPSLLYRHRNMGIAVAVLSCLLYLGAEKGNILYKYRMLASIVLLAGVTYAGHLGGTLTHGTGYLFSSPEETKTGPFQLTVPHVQDALVYRDIIRPILQARCYACHGPEKQKGKLRLDEEPYIRKGGKDGAVLSTDSDKESEMLRRIMLPPDDKDHMAPKEKGQLTTSQVKLIQWWIEKGAVFSIRVRDLEQSVEIHAILSSLENPSVATGNSDSDDLPASVKAASPEILAALQKNKVLAVPLSAGSDLLALNLLNADSLTEDLWKQVAGLSEQVISLQASGSRTNDLTLAYIASLKNLHRLDLSYSRITDNGLGSLRQLNHLVSLNLTGTSVTASGIRNLKGIGTLKNIYVFESHVASGDIGALSKEFPGTIIDNGGYTLKNIGSDTEVLKPRK